MSDQVPSSGSGTTAGNTPSVDGAFRNLSATAQIVATGGIRTPNNTPYSSTTVSGTVVPLLLITTNNPNAITRMLPATDAGGFDWTDAGQTAQLMTLLAGGLSTKPPIFPGKDDGTVQATAALYAGAGVPNNANGANGSYYFRSDTPGTALQRVYIKSAGAWVGVV